MSIDLYEECPTCDGIGERPDLSWSKTPLCPACHGRKFVKTGLTAGQVDRLVRESLWWYHADGSVEVLEDPGTVRTRRIAAAAELAELRAEREDLLDCRAALRAIASRIGCDHTEDPVGRAMLVRCVEEWTDRAEKTPRADTIGPGLRRV